MDDAIWLGLGVAALGTIFVVLSLLKTSLRHLSKVALRRMAEEAHGAKRRLLEAFDETPAEFILSLQVLIQLSLVGIVLLAAALGTLGPRPLSLGLVFVGVSLFVLVFEHFFPRFIMSVDTERVVSFLLPAYGLLEPLARTVAWPVARVFRAIFRVRPHVVETEVSEETIRAFIDVGEEEGIIRRDEGPMFESLVEFSETIVREVMTPRIDMVCIEAEKQLVDLRDLISESKHSRLPVFRERVDNIVGMVTIKDVIDAWRADAADKNVASLMRPIHFVPETTRVTQLLREFQKSRIQIAVVVDEYGGTAGLVTIEDLLEELVGDIRDEHDKPAPAVVEEPGGSYLVSGKVDIATIEDLFDLDLEGEDFDTVAGLVFATVGRVPTVGEEFAIRGLKVQVADADHRRVKKLRLARIPEPGSEDESAPAPAQEGRPV